MRQDRFAGYRQLGYDDFRELAARDDLSLHQKIGFPDEYREGFAEAILDDVRGKLPALTRAGTRILDIGAGCGELALQMQYQAGQLGQQLLLNDSAEVLAALPDCTGSTKVAGRFPEGLGDALGGWQGGFDAVLCYSVFQYVFAEANPFDFLDQALALLAPGGRLLIGDLPSSGMLQRFLASDSGKAYHRQYSGRDEDPEVQFNRPQPGKIDDAVLLGLVARARASGFEAWLVPQASSLPMANRREDLLFQRP
ncbi:class I SAM-dependent methyltransferase [Pseudomonas nicosulfuronedens]